MAFIEWTSALSVEIAEIDEQHQKLVALVNDLHAAMRQGRGADHLQKVFGELVDYTGYPHEAEHKHAHEMLIKQVDELQKQFQNGELLVSVKVLNFLRDWVVNHIEGADKRYTEFFHGAGLH